MVKDSRKIAAILAADVVEYSRLMGADEPGTLAALKICRTLIDELVKEFDAHEFRIKVTINHDGTWSYDEATVLRVRGQQEPFHHTDRNTFTRIGEPTRKPLVREPR